MLRSFTQRCTDTSTAEQYSFVFYCDISENHWASVPIPRNHQASYSLFSSLLRKRSDVREHEQAFERANREAMLYFNRCTNCFRWVCDEMFVDEKNICIECNEEREKVE